ncbi:BPTI/Kunitz domain-containing protein-like [Actinia tenebrosa]|uniref:BPTI/Kunitz domain-containing protein-like n=1 Tax=Actinia tenebrosa TaxID=6105 RepID=A0A6P8J336_ACTTE|nr:BPTI/Kunitz domain-containing protein-like [Actinia tenebrosa]
MHFNLFARSNIVASFHILNPIPSEFNPIFSANPTHVPFQSLLDHPSRAYNAITNQCFFLKGLSSSLADCNVYSYSNICLLPKVVGPCEALIPRYYYNSETKQCEKFFYGGCQGNANNFVTLEECEKTCNCGVNICDLPKIIGPCKGYFPRYHYDSKTRACQQFIYGGCNGNANNFLSRDACKKACPSYTKG